MMSGEDVDVYEQLPEGVSLFTTASAGAAAGITEHVCMYPVDVVKTRQQALACDKTSLQSRSILRNISHIWRTEGPGKLVQVREEEEKEEGVELFAKLLFSPRDVRPWPSEPGPPTPSTSPCTRR